MGKKRDVGEPTIETYEVPATAEEIEQNRERLRITCQNIMSRLAGQSMIVTINWDKVKA